VRTTARVTGAFSANRGGGDSTDGDGTVPISPGPTKFHDSKSKRTEIQLVPGCGRVEALTESGDSAVHLPVSSRRCDSRSGDGSGGFRAEVDSGQADGGSRARRKAWLGFVR
jgi:hypothetical protein